MPAAIQRNLGNFARLHQLMSRPVKLQVGIFEGKNPRRDSGPGNAKIGAYHEQLGGSSPGKLPRRSFLRDPVEKHGGEAVKAAMEGMAHDLRSGKFNDPVKKLGVFLAEKCKQAFDQSGPGWAPLAPSTIRSILRSGSRSRKKQAREGGAKPLLASGQLQRSVGWRVAR